MASPQVLAMHFAPGVGHDQPGSTWQVGEQPSPAMLFLSSQVSLPVTLPSLHTTVDTHAMPGTGHV